MSYIEHLTSSHLDMLKEIGNIGAGNAATSLSQLLDEKVDMKVPSVKVLGFDEMMEMVGGPEELIVSVFLRIKGEAPGSMFFVLSPEQAEDLVFRITGENGLNVENLLHSEMALSALHEVGNILSGSYLSALSDFTNINMQPSVPSLNIDMVGAILSFGLVELSKQSDYAIIIDTTTLDGNREEETVNGHFFLLPDPDSFKKIFNSLGFPDYE